MHYESGCDTHHHLFGPVMKIFWDTTSSCWSEATSKLTEVYFFIGNYLAIAMLIDAFTLAFTS